MKARVFKLIGTLALVMFVVTTVAPVWAAGPEQEQHPVDAWASTAFGGEGFGEIGELLKRLEGKECQNLKGRLFCTGYVGELEFVAFITGVGPQAVTQAMRDLYRYFPPRNGDYVLQFHGGIAGGYTPLQPGDSLFPEYACVNDWFLVTPVVTRGYIQVRPGDTLSHLALRYTGSAYRWPQLYELNRRVIDDPHMIKPGVPLLSPWPGVGVSDHYLPLSFRVYTSDGRAIRVQNSCFKMNPETFEFGKKVVAQLAIPPLPEGIKTYLSGTRTDARMEAQILVGHAEAAGAGFITSPEEARRQYELWDAWSTDMETAYVWWAVASEVPVIAGTVDESGNLDGHFLVDVLTLRTSSDPPDMYFGGAVTDMDYLAKPEDTYNEARAMYNTGIPFGDLIAYQSTLFADFVETGVALWEAKSP